MAKMYEFFLSERQKGVFFKPIRKKEDYLVMLLKAISAMNIYESLEIDSSSSKMILSVSKMSRLSFFSEGKYFSVAFPFKVEVIDSEIKFFSTSIGEIDSILISNILSVFNETSVIHEDCISPFADKVLDMSFYRPGIWGFLKEFFLLESGYLRYDYDESRRDELIHPLNHLDIFYTSNATFKLGLKNKILKEDLIDILNLKTNCYYLSKP